MPRHISGALAYMGGRTGGSRRAQHWQPRQGWTGSCGCCSAPRRSACGARAGRDGVQRLLETARHGAPPRRLTGARARSARRQLCADPAERSTPQRVISAGDRHSATARSVVSHHPSPPVLPVPSRPRWCWLTALSLVRVGHPSRPVTHGVVAMWSQFRAAVARPGVWQQVAPGGAASRAQILDLVLCLCGAPRLPHRLVEVAAYGPTNKPAGAEPVRAADAPRAFQARQSRRRSG
jgi:hypothetical protein